MTSKNYLLKVIICIFFIFSTVAASISTIIYSTVLSEKFYDKIIEKYEISEAVYDQIESEFTQNAHSSGIDADVYMQYLDESSIDEMIKNNVSAGLAYCKGKSDSYDYITNLELTDLDNGISDFFSEYADTNGYEKDAEYNEKVSQAISEANSIIKTNVDIFRFSTMNDAGLLSKVHNLYSKISALLIGVIVLFAALFILMIFVAKKKEAFYWLGCNFFASGILMLLPSIYFKSSGLIGSFVVKDESIYYAVTGLMTGCLNQVLRNAVVFLIIGIAEIVLKVVVTVKFDKE